MEECNTRGRRNSLRLGLGTEERPGLTDHVTPTPGSSYKARNNTLQNQNVMKLSGEILVSMDNEEKEEDKGKGKEKEYEKERIDFHELSSDYKRYIEGSLKPPPYDGKSSRFYQRPENYVDMNTISIQLERKAAEGGKKLVSMVDEYYLYQLDAKSKETINMSAVPISTYLNLKEEELKEIKESKETEYICICF